MHAAHLSVAHTNEVSLSRALRLASICYQTMIERALRKAAIADLTMRDLDLLQVISQADGLAMFELTRLLQRSRQSANKLCSALIDHGYLERVQPGGLHSQERRDARERIFKITPLGEEALHIASQESQQLEEELEAHLTEQDVDDLVRMLTKIVDATGIRAPEIVRTLRRLEAMYPPQEIRNHGGSQLQNPSTESRPSHSTSRAHSTSGELDLSVEDTDVFFDDRGGQPTVARTKRT